ncbi:MAG: hypothetical protein FJX11_02880 [Alphaproteobacteria bacterium]|nr:hypothetical protein [Alphaproteobacteria bacterium]
MNESDLDTIAGEYVLGTLAGPERDDFERRLQADHAARRAVDAWSARVGAMLTAPPAAPSAGLWQRIEASIDERQAVDFGGVNVRAADGEWIEIAPGAATKKLFVDRTAGRWSFLLRLAPGAVVPRHVHKGFEECMVVSGDMALGDTVFFAGDYHLARPDTTHPPLTSRGGGLVFIRAPIDTHL